MGQGCLVKTLRSRKSQPGKSSGWLSMVSILLTLVGCSAPIVAPPNTSPVASPSPSPTSSPSPSPTTSPSPIANKPEAVQAFETRLSQEVAQVIGLPLQTIDCPANVELKANNRFECQGISEGQAFAIAVNMTDDPAKFQWGTKGLLLLPKLEAFIQKRVKDKSGLDVKADCGGKLRVAKSGDSFECKVTDTRNQARSAKVIVKDDQGSVDISLQ